MNGFQKIVIFLLALLVCLLISVFAILKTTGLAMAAEATIVWEYPNAPPDLKGFELECGPMNKQDGEATVIYWDQTGPPWEYRVQGIPLFPDGKTRCVMRAVDQAGQKAPDSDPYVWDPAPEAIIHLKIIGPKLIVEVQQ